MKRTRLYLFLAAEALALGLLNLASDRFPALFSAAAAFPMEQLGLGLRALSGAGWLGRGAAVALWAAIGLLPMAFALRHAGEPDKRWENLTLYVLSLWLLAVLYCMVNPGFVTGSLTFYTPALLPMLKAVLGCSVWAIAVCYAVLRLLRQFRAGETEQLLRYLQKMLYVLCALFVGAVALPGVGALAAALLQAQTGADRAFAWLRFGAAALPYVMDLLVTLAGLTLLEELLAGNREAAGDAADRLCRVCCTALGVVTAAVVTLNYAQLLFLSGLSSLDVTATIPVMSLAFVLLVLLASRLLRDNGRLSDENAAFI